VRESNRSSPQRRDDEILRSAGAPCDEGRIGEASSRHSAATRAYMNEQATSISAASPRSPGPANFASTMPPLGGRVHTTRGRQLLAERTGAHATHAPVSSDRRGRGITADSSTSPVVTRRPYVQVRDGRSCGFRPFRRRNADAIWPDESRPTDDPWSASRVALRPRTSGSRCGALARLAEALHE